MIYRQSGVVPFRKTGNEILIMLVTSRKNKRWVIPKGIVEEYLTPQESAAKEAVEEAGISGKVYKREIGEYSYEKWGGLCKVKVYPMKVENIQKKWQEDFRTRKWHTIDEAASLVKEKKLKKIIRELPRQIK